jgi:hypothetical protein
MTEDNKWTPLHTWKKAVTDRQNGVATAEQETILDKGHWSAN